MPMSLYKRRAVLSMAVQFEASSLADLLLSSKSVPAEMVKLLRYSAQRKSRMRYMLLWFILTGIAKETFSLDKVPGNTRHSKTEINDFKSSSTDISATKSNSKDSQSDKVSKSAFSSKRILRSVPVRKQKENESPESIPLENSKLETIEKYEIYPKNTLIYPYYRPGRTTAASNSENDELETSLIELQNYGSDLKRHDTVIPMVRFGRATKMSEGKSNSVIPYPRFGKSINQGMNEIHDDGIATEDISYATVDDDMDRDNEYFEDIDDSIQYDDNIQAQKRVLDDVETIIPYPRPGREILEDDETSELWKRRSEESEGDLLVPQMRYGRSMLLLSPPKAKEPTASKTPQTFVLPYPRPGRSLKQKVKLGNLKNQYLILPYPRPGRSLLAENDDRLYNDEVLRYQSSSAISGLSSLDILSDMDDEDGIYINGEGFLGLKVNPLYLKGEEKNLSRKPKDKDESNSVFMIPYPRPGKKSMINIMTEKQQPKQSEKTITDYVVPYPRPGKKSSSEMRNMIKSNHNKNQNNPSQTFVLPYPRPGRSIKYLLEGSAKSNEEIKSSDDDKDSSEFFEKAAFGNENKLIPYGILDDDYNVMPYLRSERYGENGNIIQFDEDNGDLKSDEAYIDKNFIFGLGNFEQGGSTSDHFRLKRSIFEKRSDSILPYPRFGKSVSVVPYPRLGRSNSDVFNPKFVKSGSVIPYPRFGRSNLLVPYPRFGKSSELTNVEDDTSKSTAPYLKVKRSNVMVPYPRPGRSEAVVPYPRPGRSEAVVPYPRPGRSEAVVPYPRPGRSEAVISYPRPGRSSVVPYPRPGRSSVVPYPRPGRSTSVVPYPRPGRSSSVVPYPRTGRSLSVVPYPRPGRSTSVVPYPRPGRSEVIVPYPRPGRSESVVPYPRPGRSTSVVSYPRPGRSDVIVPYPRPGRSEVVIPYPRPGRTVSLVPYPRPGRSGAVVPYPRPGRSTAIVPYPRPGRSTAIVPYPRPGRSNFILPYPRQGKSLSVEEQLSSEKTPELGKWLLPNVRPGRSKSKNDDAYIVPYPRPGRSDDEFNVFMSTHPKSARRKKQQGYILPHPRIGRAEESGRVESVIPYPRLGRSEKEITPPPNVMNSVHKLNKHMLNTVDGSVYLLPYPRPGRYAK